MIGIFQGRLVESTNGQLQCGPGPRWSEELRIAGRLGFDYVELLAEEGDDPANPMWSPEGRGAIRDVCEEAGLRLVSMCAVGALERPISDPGFATQLAERLAPVVEDLGLQTIVVALDDASDLRVLDRESAADGVRTLAAGFGGLEVRIALECSLSGEDSARFLDRIDVPAVGLCYDLGNATAAGFVPGREIRDLGDRIVHVHAKDKDALGANVEFGTGTVDFPAAFDALRRVRYTGAVTVEATRGDDPVVTAARHREFLSELAGGDPGLGA